VNKEQVSEFEREIRRVCNGMNCTRFDEHMALVTEKFGMTRCVSFYFSNGNRKSANSFCKKKMRELESETEELESEIKELQEELQSKRDQINLFKKRRCE